MWDDCVWAVMVLILLSCALGSLYQSISLPLLTSHNTSCPHGCEWGVSALEWEDMIKQCV